MLKIRLQRVGKKHEPVFRVVVCDSKRGPKSGDNVEILGSYDPRDKNETKVDADRVQHWISQGAQVSDTVNNLLINLEIIKGKKINVLPKKAPIVKEESEEETKEETPAEEVAAEESKEEAPVPDSTEQAPAEEEKTEEVKEEPVVEETPAEESKEEAPAEEEKPAE